MSFADAIKKAGDITAQTTQPLKKRYSELVSHYLAPEVAAGLRAVGFPNVKPLPNGKKEKEFQGGLGSKRVDVAYSDEQHGLILAVSIKSICYPPYGKNLKNRFGDVCTEAITLHMRFPYSVVGVLFAFPEDADNDSSKQRKVSTFKRAAKLLATIGGRQEYTDPDEKFENVTMLLFKPATPQNGEPGIRLFDARSMTEYTSEIEYFRRLRDIYNYRNPHKLIGEEPLEED